MCIRDRGLAAFCVILFILTVVNMAKTSKLRKKYEAFMMGKDAKSLEMCIRDSYNIFDKSSDQLDIHIVGITQPWFVGETAAQKIHGIYRMFLLKSF